MSLPQTDKEKWLTEKHKKMPNAICWTCKSHNPELAPAPCKYRKRFQNEGFCTGASSPYTSLGVKK